MDYAALAKQFGGAAVEAPQQAQTDAPAWQQNLSRKDLGEIQMKMYAEGRKRLADLQSHIADAGVTMGDLEEFGRLNRENSTGSLWQQITPDKPIFRTDDSMKMAAIQSRLAPQTRPPGSGSTSDRDMALFLRALPSLENTGDTNKGIREEYARRYQAAIAKATAMQQHLDKYGNLMDFDSQWAQRNQPQAATPAAPAAQASATPWNIQRVK